MKLNRILGIAAVVLLVTLTAQLCWREDPRPRSRAFARWKYRPTSVKATKDLADTVVLARVTNVRTADPLVVPIPGEPGEVDRVPVEVVSLQVEKFYKGGGSASIEILRTGATDLATPAPDLDPVANQISLDDDPSYVVHDASRNDKKVKYVLFLRPGPRLTSGGATIDTKAVVAPEGRFLVDDKNKLKPAVPGDRGGFGNTKFRDKDLSALETEINQNP
jgi:hypothetical protein